LSIGARYQPGAARQKEAVSMTTAPFRTPEVTAPSACRVFDPSLHPCWFLHTIENSLPSPGGTHTEEQPMTSQFKHENVIKLAGVLGAQPELRLTTNGNAVAALIIYTNYILRNADGTTRQESERHRVIVWGLHAEKAARLLRKGSKVRVQGRMTYPT